MGWATSGDHTSEGGTRRTREQRHKIRVSAHAHTVHMTLHMHTGAHLHTHTQRHTGINTTYTLASKHVCARTSMHTPWQVLTEKLLQGPSWTPRTWQREPRCQGLLSNTESQFGNSQPRSWLGRRTIPTIPRQAHAPFPPPQPCTTFQQTTVPRVCPGSSTTSTAKGLPVGAPCRVVTTLYASFGSVFTF